MRLSAQDVIDNNSDIDIYEYAGQLMPKTLLDRTSVKFDNVSLEYALNSLKQDHRLNLSYNTSQIHLEQRVRVKMDDVFVLEALLGILKNTGMTLEITKGGNIAITPRAGQPGGKKEKPAAAILTGHVLDKATQEPLPGANIILQGTAIGTASDIKGRYKITKIPPGNYSVTVTYIGYKSKNIAIRLAPGKAVIRDITLVYDVVEGETVTITAQAEGQVAAINQQLRSNTIKNVVSAERIMELPDANAAESVGRLPGISIKRSGGEGNRVVIRGLAPTYNSITVGGEKVPATDLDDRSVDLNMISPEILDGIEVTKALTPDMDADAFGGTVNFKLADAPSGFRSNIRVQQGYNQHRDEPGQYKGSLTLSNRYLDEKFGIMVTGNIEQAQRGSDQFNAGYSLVREKREGEEFAPVTVGGVNLEYVDEIRERLGFSVLADYRLRRGKLMFSNFFTRLDRDEYITTRDYYVDGNTHDYDFRDRQRQIDIMTNSFSGEHSLYFGTIDWRLSRTSSSTRHPFDNTIGMKELSAFDQSQLSSFNTADDLIGAAINDLDNTFLYNGHFRREKSLERDYNAQVNIDIPYVFGNNVAGYLKFGGKYVNKAKNRDRFHMSDRLEYWQSAYARYHTRRDDPGFEYQRIPGTGFASIYNYIDDSIDTEGFLNGDYPMDVALDRNELNHLFNSYLLDSLYTFSSLEELDDYETTEETSAGYIMTEINIGRFFMIMPGVRYERTFNDMTGREGNVPSDHIEPELNNPYVSDTTATANYDNWFPMIHTRIRPTSWFDIRLAYTESISRPRLDWMLPKKKVRGNRQLVEYGRPDLRPQLATNYDLFISFYSNRLGLLTLGGFYKDIGDLIFRREGHKILNAEKEGFPRNLQGFWLDRPENNPYKTDVRGFEVEWQTSLNWLPSPFDGFVINANYSHIWSETRFPRSFVVSEQIPVFPFIKATVIDTFRIGDMPDQADDIANLALGYDKGPFSARLSMLYQGRTLSRVGERPELDGFTADLLRFDLSVKYSLTPQIGLFMNYNNITNEPDESYMLNQQYLTSREYYGWTMDFGVGYAL
jgi:TonB-dependent receptor